MLELRMFSEIEKLRHAHGLPERMELALMDAAFGYKVRNGRYRQENNISDVVASRDLKRLSELGFLMRMGEKRGRYYRAAKPLLEMRSRCADSTRAADPYDLIGIRPIGQRRNALRGKLPHG